MDAARDLVTELLRPASWEDCTALAKRLRSACVMPMDLREDMDAVIEDRARELSEHPADIAREAVRTWPRTPGGKFLPTVRELRDHCLSLSRDRRLLACAVDEALERNERGEALPDDTHRPVDPVLHQRVKRDIANLAQTMRATVQATRDDEARKAAAARRPTGPTYATAEGALPATRNSEMAKAALASEERRAERAAARAAS